MLTPKELRSRRIAMRLTTSELAELLGVPADTLDAWERGEVAIDDATLLERLAALEQRRASQRKNTAS